MTMKRLSIVIGFVVLAIGRAAAAFGSPARADIPGNWSDAVPMVAGAGQHFVAPDGKPTGAGTKESPWDIVSALEGGHSIRPGDILWIRGGTYRNPDRKHSSQGWKVNLCGTEKAPVFVRAYPGEHVTIDSGLQLGFKGKAEHVWLWDLELVTSDLQRETKTAGTAPMDLNGPLGGLHVATSTGCKFINLVIHDTYQAIGYWVGALDSEVHGCLIYQNGWKGPDRCHGHCIYTQNRDGTKTISGCIFSTPFGHGQQLIQAYGSKAAWVNGFRIEDNISYAMAPQGNRLLVGGQADGNRDNRVLRNYFFNATLQLGYSGKNHTDGYVGENVLFNGSIVVHNYLDVEVRDNLVVGGGINTDNCGQVTNQRNQTFAKGKRADTPRAFLIPNKYDPTRAHLALFNWAGMPTAQVKVAPFLKAGDSYQLLDPHNFYGKPLLAGKCEGEMMPVPIEGTFGAFVVLKGDRTN
jgi:hypothetical protein